MANLIIALEFVIIVALVSIIVSKHAAHKDRVKMLKRQYDRLKSEISKTQE